MICGQVRPFDLIDFILAKIFPFKGWRYNSDIINEYSDVIVPPYDVITPEEQNIYYDRSSYNYIRINLNPSPGNDRYENASSTLDQWKKNRVLIEEDHNAIYIIAQTFEQDGRTVERIGCICSIQLTELGNVVLPHEKTIEKHLNDRLRLMEATRANTGQIFMCYRDEEMILENIYETIVDKPVIDVRLDDVQYRVWPVTQTDKIDQFLSGMLDKTLVIADGHHRYKTALRYRLEHLGSDDASRVMVTLVNSNNSGMQILPTHRLLSGVELNIDEIKARLETLFQVESLDGVDALLAHMDSEPERKGMLGLYHRESDTGLLLNFTGWNKLKTMLPDAIQTLREMNTNILHLFVLGSVFNIDTNDQEHLKHVSYMRGNKPILDMLKKKSDYSVACFVNPPSLDDVFNIAESGETMPQKSTFFFPKIYSGLVTRCFEN